jgi:hypothetical protein
MTDDEGLSARDVADWCGSGVTVREVTRLRQLADLDSGRVHVECLERQCSGSGGRPTVREGLVDG